MTQNHQLHEFSSTREVHLVKSNSGDVIKDIVIAEEPLEIILESSTGERLQLATTMRTPGDDAFLALGYLVSEDMISSAAEISDVFRPDDIRCSDSDPSSNQVIIKLTSEELPSKEEHSRLGLQSSSCGLCGNTSIENILQSQYPNRVSATRVWYKEDVQRDLAEIEKHQPLFQTTGGSHGAWLINSDHQVVASFEDIGRHNCVDKILGYLLLNPEQKSPNHTLLLSSRLSYELVHKAGVMGINIMGSVGAPSSLAVELAKKLGITTFGFLKTHQFNIYTNPNFYFQF